ncbi:MAG: ImmA/IrrE family metallo-endopeptidase [Acidobacteriota bacterium]
MLKVIKTPKDYEEALAALAELTAIDPKPGSDDATRLELLALLVEDYETRTYPPAKPSPLEAIRFRMEQMGLTQKDLVPFIGSRSKVSEMLSGKRRLTLGMIRSLNRGLGIPAEVLLQQEQAAVLETTDIEWVKFPLRQMAKRGWIQPQPSVLREQAEELMQTFFNPIGGPSRAVALYRQTSHVRSSRPMDRHALVAWTARVLILASRSENLAPYKPQTVTLDFLRELAKLSWSDRGPLIAAEFLAKHGIVLVVEAHLPRTHLDGAALTLPDGRPVVALTLRYDRLDNFWFTLLHELAHVGRHLEAALEQQQMYLDDLDSTADSDSREREADELAGEALIPHEAWSASAARFLRSPDAAKQLAHALRIHPAIVAGQMRREAGNYRILGNLVGQGRVRCLFPDVRWS